MNATTNTAAASSISVGDEIELDITNVAHGGVFVSRYEGRVVFVSDAIPGERVLARVTEARKKSFVRASTLRVITPSEHRRDHVWAAAGLDRDPADRAGGAEFGHIDLAEQRRLLATVITESLSRMAGIDREVVVEAAPGDDECNGLGWRTRISLHTDAEGRVGPYAARTHNVVDVTDYPLAHHEVTELALSLPGTVRAGQTLDVIAPSASPPFVAASDAKRGPQRGSARIRERVGNREFELSKTGFWQVHLAAPDVLTAAVQEAINPDIFDPSADNLDLYGGVGLLAAAVLDRFPGSTRITTVESDVLATECAADNLADSPGAYAATGRVDSYLAHRERGATPAERDRMRAATVVLDPPRSGAGGDVCASLLSMAPAQLVYVACDPVAFARDAATLTAGGYTLTGMRAFDLFPHTHHVEVVATLVRNDLV